MGATRWSFPEILWYCTRGAMQSVQELETDGLVAGRAEQNARSDDTGAAEQLEKRLARRRDQARAKRQSETAEY